MSQTTSSRNHNYLALRGADVDDMEFVEQFGLDPSLAYTPQLNEAMLDLTMDQNIASGMDKDEAMKVRTDAARDLKELMAKRGMLS